MREGCTPAAPILIAITIPSTFLGVLCGALSVAWRGKELSDDTDYQQRLASGQAEPPEKAPEFDGRALTNARGSTIPFLLGIAVVVLIGTFPNLRPAYQIVSDGGVDTDQVSMGTAIMIVMLTIAGLTTLLFKSSPNVMLKGTMMQSGVSAIISILGVAWLGFSFFEGNRGAIVAGILRLVDSHPWAVSRQNLVRVENAAIPLVPRIEKRAWTRVSVALRSAKVLFRRGAGHIRHTYIRIGKNLVWVRQPDGNDDAARPVDPEKERARRRWSVFCSPGFPSATQDACGLRGSSGRIQRANVSDGVHSRQ